jgi:hypothetical protein
MEAERKRLFARSRRVIWHPDMPTEYRNQIVTGDARELAKRIPDESVDLVFTDPVYERIDDYRWLAEESARVLKPGGACLAWISTSFLVEITAAMSQHLSFQWLLFSHIPGGPQPHLWFGFCKQKTCLWFGKGERSKPRRTTFDVVNSPTFSMGKHHRWQKSIQACREWIDAFSPPEGIVWEPFSGGGTTAVVCREQGRQYVAFEIDPETATIGRERVRMTPEPLFVMDPPELQQAFELEGAAA